MKYIIRLCVSVFLITMVFSCAEDGVDGAPGPAGQDAESNFLFEYENVSFLKEFDYEYTLGFPDNFLLTTDNIFVFFQWGVYEGSDIWRPLPQTVFKKDGTLIYNYDFINENVRLFLEADFEMDTLTTNDTDNWVVRAVVVPSNFHTRKATSVDYSNYYEVIDYYGLDHNNPRVINNDDYK